MQKLKPFVKILICSFTVIISVFLETLVLSQATQAENDILNSIYEKYRYSEIIFTYFFTTPMTDEQRWDFIEEYFLGASEERLLNYI